MLPRVSALEIQVKNKPLSFNLILYLESGTKQMNGGKFRRGIVTEIAREIYNSAETKNKNINALSSQRALLS